MTTQTVTITLIYTNFPGDNFNGCEALQVGLQVGRGRENTIVDAFSGIGQALSATPALMGIEASLVVCSLVQTPTYCICYNSKWGIFY